MRILSSAQACGFGPVSKLTAVTALFPEDDVDFIGQDVSLDFAHRHRHRFREISQGDTSRWEDLEDGLRSADLVLSVMDAELVFWAIRARVPVLFFDSLLAFWLCGRSMRELAARAELVRSASLKTARVVYEELAPHERIMLAHLLARRSYAQNFPGVPERIAQFTDLGAGQVELCGPIIDFTGLRASLESAPPERPAGLLVNLGGFQNFFLDYDSHNAYLAMLERWVRDVARRNPDLGRILVCCGAYGEAVTEQVGDVEVEFTFLPHGDFLRHLAHTPLYAVPPSLTSLHEAVVVGRMPLLLPEQHYGHIANQRALGDTTVGRMSASLQLLDERFDVPEDDLEGTRELDRQTRELLGDEGGYATVRGHMDARLDAYRNLTEAARGAAIREVGELLGGPSLADLLDASAVDGLLAAPGPAFPSLAGRVND